MTILFIIIFALWALVVLKYTLFWTYLWQLKEYRFDRMKVHFELFSSRKLFLNKRNAWLVLLLATAAAPFNPARVAAAGIVLLFYAFFAVRTTQQIQRKTLKRPDFTFRTLLVVAGSLAAHAALSAVMFIFAYDWLLIWFVVGDLIVPVVVAAAVATTHPLAAFFKNKTIQKATKKRQQFKDLLVVGITGSYGKSSMKELLSAILSEQFKILKTPKNVNVDIGIARVILKKLTKKHEVFVVEMGAYRKGEIAKSAQMAKPHIGVLTGINPQHASLFGSLQDIQKAKYELIESLGNKGLAVFNGNDEDVRALAKKTRNPKRVYAANTVVDKTNQPIITEEIRNTAKGLQLHLRERGGEEQVVTTPLVGNHNAINVVGAITVARELGVEWGNIKNALKNIKPPKHALEIKKGIKDTTVIDDTYSANVSGVMAALDLVNSMKGRQKICVLQPLIELGPSAERIHKKVGARIGEVCDWCIVTSRDYFSVMYKEALDNGMSKDAMFSIPNPRDALRKAQEISDKEDIILLENRVPNTVLEGLLLHKEE